MIKCQFCHKEFHSKFSGVKTHEKFCKQNPHQLTKRIDFIPWNKGKTKENDNRLKQSSDFLKRRFRTGEITPNWQGKQLPEEMKRKISVRMKLAHKEGRAWNIGMSRWNNEKSWPEKFFMEVIQNEFADKDVKTEYPVSIYSLDFAWVHKKKCIEVDGKQHRQQEYKERDNRKDALLLEQGWQILRIPWSEMCKDTKTWIAKAKLFIDS